MMLSCPLSLCLYLFLPTPPLTRSPGSRHPLRPVGMTELYFYNCRSWRYGASAETASLTGKDKKRRKREYVPCALRCVALCWGHGTSIHRPCFPQRILKARRRCTIDHPPRPLLDVNNSPDHLRNGAWFEAFFLFLLC